MSEKPRNAIFEMEDVREFTAEPMAIIKETGDSLNHRITFVNDKFTDVMGWTLEDIPDKETWWQKAYPDPDYRHAVEKQWELLFLEARELGESTIELDVNITNKFQVENRFHVCAEIESQLLPDHYVVIFTPLVEQ